jgi:tRNA U38,U39,U40 pseudouridine synthase TruA
MKSVEQQIFEFLQSNPSVWHGGDLQRMLFKTRRGGYSTGDTIKRRLNDLVEEGKIHVSYNERNEAMFSIREEHKKKTYSYIPITLPDGSRAVREVVS